MAGCVATQSDVDVVKEKVTYVEDDLYETSKVIANRLKTIEENSDSRFADIEERMAALSRERASLAEEISSLNSEIRRLHGEIDETEHLLTEQLKTERDINQKADFEIRRDMESLKKTYSDIITSISSLNTNLTVIQNDLLSVNKSQITIAESLNKLSSEVEKIAQNTVNTEQRMEANMQVFLDELTRQESEIIHLKSTLKPQTSSQTSSSAKTYVVKSGDSLGKIAEQFKTTISELKKHNNLKTDVIYTGQRLNLP